MAIDFATTTITISKTTTVGAAATNAAVKGIFFDSTSQQLYVATAANAAINWRRIDLTIPASPVGNAWAPDNPTILNIMSATDTRDDNHFYYDVATNFVYVLRQIAAGVMKLARINLGTSVVTYAAEEFRKTAGATFTAGSYTVGFTIIGTTLYSTFWDANLSKYRLAKYSIGSLTWGGTDTTVGTLSATLYVSLYAAELGFLPVSLLQTSDSNYVVLYDDLNMCEKYNSNTDLVGVCDFSASGVGVMFERGGYFWTTNSNLDSTSNLIINRYLDNSTGVVSKVKSLLSTPQRLVKIGENASLQITFKAYDDFGVAVTTLSGQQIRFSIVTSRGVIDENDSALATGSGGPFRDGANVPLNRSLITTFDGTGQASIYFQSARVTGGYIDISDTVRIEYPVV